MRTLLVLVLLACSNLALAQTPATYAERATFATDPVFEGRVMISTLVTAASVLGEADTTPDNAVRVRFAGYVLRDPDRVARMLTKVLAANIAVETVADVPRTTLTDAQLLSFVQTRWTPLAKALMAGFANVP